MKQMNFKEQAEKWAEKELENNPLLRQMSQEVKDAVELMMFGSIVYHIDENGNRRKLSQQELWELKSNKNVTNTEISSEDLY